MCNQWQNLDGSHISKKQRTGTRTRWYRYIDTYLHTYMHAVSHPCSTNVRRFQRREPTSRKGKEILKRQQEVGRCSINQCFCSLLHIQNFKYVFLFLNLIQILVARVRTSTSTLFRRSGALPHFCFHIFSWSNQLPVDVLWTKAYVNLWSLYFFDAVVAIYMLTL